MPTVSDITSLLEHEAPLDSQLDYDNSGLIVGNSQASIASALLTVDITEDVLEEAVELGTGLIISHHPIIFHPLKRITGSNNIQRVVEGAIRHQIALYACHTNLDAAPEGISHRLGRMLSLQQTAVLEPGDKYPDTGIGIVGELTEPMPMIDFLRRVKDTLHIEALRYASSEQRPIQRVAICSGSGASLIGAAKAHGADIYLAADFRYNDFLDLPDQMAIADIGHFESEYCAIDILFDIITKKIPTFALYKSTTSANPIKYIK